MKPALEWINAVGEAVMASAFIGQNPPGKEVETIIEAIQNDACDTLTRERDQLQLEIEADNVVIRETRKERDQLAAQVARLRAILFDPYSGPTEAVRIARNALSESPPEALHQLKREWIGPTIEILGLIVRDRYGGMAELKLRNAAAADELTRLTAILGG